MNKKDAKKKGVGYSAEDRKSMKVLIERTQPDAGDYVGSGTVTNVKKSEKKMRGGGLARKGVGMALAKGGLAKANGCVMRGKTRGKMV